MLGGERVEMLSTIAAVLFAALTVIFAIRAFIYKVAMHKAIMVFKAYIDRHNYDIPSKEEIDECIASIDNNDLASAVFGKAFKNF
ncbi:hypothetical protein ACTQZS_12505 [Bilifractor sp. LCP19S3_H10]|uniref:hypothetical protein n=1 Tax=Bilifractor sp. LCP19S3_H10 TaxID=3438736 RepID=UPI003F93B7C0